MREQKKKARNPNSLSEYVHATSRVALDEWQLHMCRRLEKLVYQKGQRIAIHAMPQAGKSCILSQRFPTYYIGHQPTARIKLACYNIRRAAKHGKICRTLMQSAIYRLFFPADGLRIPERCSTEEWSTRAREATLDPQPSFMALGLQTGFVGEGADLLIIDDPYASPQDAMSEVVRASTWQFWEEGASVRLTEDTNVVMMFHRYHGADIAGQMFEAEGLIEDGGRWEVLRYAAQADDEAHCMPPGRESGSYLSSRFSDAWYRGNEAKGLVWHSQFQGRPSSKAGLFFQPDKIGVVDTLPLGLSWCRPWDLAATQGGGDFTVGGLIGMDRDGNVYIADCDRGQWGPERVEAAVFNAPKQDPKGCMNHLAQDPGSAGKLMAHRMAKELTEKGYRAMYELVSGSKESRAWDFACAVNSGIVNMVRAPWNSTVRESLRAFPLGLHDDIEDCFSDGYNFLESMRPKEGNVSTWGNSGGYQ